MVDETGGVNKPKIELFSALVTQNCFFRFLPSHFHSFSLTTRANLYLRHFRLLLQYNNFTSGYVLSCAVAGTALQKGKLEIKWNAKKFLVCAKLLETIFFKFFSEKKNESKRQKGTQGMLTADSCFRLYSQNIAFFCAQLNVNP